METMARASSSRAESIVQRLAGMCGGEINEGGGEKEERMNEMQGMKGMKERIVMSKQGWK